MNKEHFRLNDQSETDYYTIPSFEESGLVNHAFTTRGLNLGFNTIDSKEDIVINFKIICGELKTSIEDSVLSLQTHKTDIRIVTSNDKGKGLIKERDYNDVDGLVTDQRGIALFTFYADCVPLFFLDPKKKVVGVAHGGWKGTVGKIARNMIETMRKQYDSQPEDILVGIGPSIGSCCYEVSKDVYDQFDKNFADISSILKESGKDKWSLDLWQANKLVLEESGIPCSNITTSNLCTSCNNDKFFSYRKENGKTGRMAATIMLK